MKTCLKIAAWVTALTLFVPQFFVLSYYFPIVVKGVNRWAMLQELALLGLVISWVSAPIFLVIVLLYRALVSRRVRWYGVIVLCMLSGFGLVAAWNHVVFDLFSYWRAALPVLLCCLATAGYALSREFYFRGLPMPPPPAPVPAPVSELESTGTDLPE